MLLQQYLAHVTATFYLNCVLECHNQDVSEKFLHLKWVEAQVFKIKNMTVEDSAHACDSEYEGQTLNQ